MPWETLGFGESTNLVVVWIHMVHYSRGFFQTILQVRDPVTFMKY